MSRGGPLRLLGGAVGGWVAVRIMLVLAPGAVPVSTKVPVPMPVPVGTGMGVMMPGPVATAGMAAGGIGRAPQPPVTARHSGVPGVTVAVTVASPVMPGRPAEGTVRPVIAPRVLAMTAPHAYVPPDDVAALMLAAYQPMGARPFRRTDTVQAEAFAHPPSADGDPLPGRWSAQAWLFARGRGGRGFAPGGQLGGGQAGIRVVRRIGRHLALAARMSVATADAASAEAAAGVDWLPFGAGVPFRTSIERRIALGPHARNAWSAYVAGGFYGAVARDMIVDGYAQAGVVGAKRRDLFADGAVRAGRQMTVGPSERLTLGAGAWGAAQPGAERLDIGPRAAVSVPLGTGATGVVALEGRMRVAGAARPGSGLALTLATDF